jgi:uncharacterized membrane protein YciS (DUF1049 family)
MVFIVRGKTKGKEMNLPEEIGSSSAPSRNSFRLSNLLILFLTLIISAYLVFTIMCSHGAGAFQTRLSLKKEGCDLIQSNGIAIEVNYSPTRNICMLELPFRSNLFGGGGVINFSDTEINIANEQIISIELVDEKAAIQSRLVDLVMIVFCTGFLLGTLRWITKR